MAPRLHRSGAQVHGQARRAARHRPCLIGPGSKHERRAAADAGVPGRPRHATLRCGAVASAGTPMRAAVAMCVVQVACADAVYLFDALELADLAPLGELLANDEITKVIHNASFERSVLGRQGIEVVNVVDTLELRPGADGGHSLRAVCERELGLVIDKAEQTSDWTRRPLTPKQVAYAALDAEVLLELAKTLHGT